MAASLAACAAGALGALGVLGAGFLVTGTAQAAPAAATCGQFGQRLCAPTVTWTTSETDGTITIKWTSDGNLDTVAPGTPTLQWQAQANPPITAPSVTTDPAPLTGGSCTTGVTVVCTYPWPAGLEVNGYVVNGTYSVNASAEDCVIITALCSGSTSTSVTQSIPVANPPAPPTGVVSAPGSTPSTAKISWNPNPEPDVAGYQVLRFASGSSSSTVACLVPAVAPNPKQYTCTDAPPKDGAYTYEVIADRWGATYDNHVDKQAASQPSAATKAVSVVGTSANTTTTVPAGGGTLGPAGFVPKLTPAKSASGATGGAGFSPKLSPAATTPAPVDTPANGDTGFLPSLPYGQRAATPTTSDPAVLTVPSTPKAKTNSVGAIAIVGAGLLLGVIALHGLWLRSEVRRSGALEVLEPHA